MLSRSLIFALFSSGILVLMLCTMASTLPIPTSVGTTEHAEQLSQGETSTLADLSIGEDIKNYIGEEEELEEILERLRKEQDEKLALNPTNYLADNVSVDEIMRLFDDVAETTPSPQSIEATPPSTPTTATTENERDLECSICLNSMQNTRVHVLPCRHKFHAACLKDWIEHGKVG